MRYLGFLSHKISLKVRLCYSSYTCSHHHSVLFIFSQPLPVPQEQVPLNELDNLMRENRETIICLVVDELKQVLEQKFRVAEILIKLEVLSETLKGLCVEVRWAQTLVFN